MKKSVFSSILAVVLVGIMVCGGFAFGSVRANAASLITFHVIEKNVPDDYNNLAVGAWCGLSTVGETTSYSDMGCDAMSKWDGSAYVATQKDKDGNYAVQINYDSEASDIQYIGAMFIRYNSANMVKVQGDNAQQDMMDAINAGGDVYVRIDYDANTISYSNSGEDVSEVEPEPITFHIIEKNVSNEYDKLAINTWNGLSTTGTRTNFSAMGCTELEKWDGSAYVATSKDSDGRYIAEVKYYPNASNVQYIGAQYIRYNSTGKVAAQGENAAEDLIAALEAGGDVYVTVDYGEGKVSYSTKSSEQKPSEPASEETPSESPSEAPSESDKPSEPPVIAPSESPSDTETDAPIDKPSEPVKSDKIIFHVIEQNIPDGCDKLAVNTWCGLSTVGDLTEFKDLGCEELLDWGGSVLVAVDKYSKGNYCFEVKYNPDDDNVQYIGVQFIRYNDTVKADTQCGDAAEDLLVALKAGGDIDVTVDYAAGTVTFAVSDAYQEDTTTAAGEPSDVVAGSATSTALAVLLVLAGVAAIGVGVVAYNSKRSAE